MEVTYIDHLGDDISVVNAARVSFAKESSWEYPFDDADESLKTLSQRDKKLIDYLARHKHISPFGHCFASFRIKAPVFVARQLVKHKFLRINEVSRRYVDDPPEFYSPTVWRGVSEDKKQGSEGVVPLPPGALAEVYQVSRKTYLHLLSQGVAPEQARMVLPQSMMTEWIWSGSLDAFASMCNLRCAEDTQYESRVIAQGIDKHMKECYPYSWEALRKYGGA